MPVGLIKRLFGGGARRQTAALYADIVAAARQPHWYLDGGVEDSISGRYEAIAMVFAAVAIRLEALGDAGQLSSVALTECFVDDMEGQLRQDGVGDVSVGKKIGTLVGGLGGRIGAYRDGLAGDDALLDAALRRNLYRGEPAADTAVAHVRGAFRSLNERLSARSLEALMTGEI
jgi:cytochrome b pre-mRNA-processing protein 3